MKFPVRPAERAIGSEPRSIAPRRSLVRVLFEDDSMCYTYYNDRFNLRPGDLVFVSGKLSDLPGTVSEVCLNFKISLGNYERVIALADTSVHGKLIKKGGLFFAFDEKVLPKQKVRSWFLPPRDPDDQIVSENDGTSFSLSEPFPGRDLIRQRGLEYFEHELVRYLSLDGPEGYAIVEGSRPYEVEFQYRGGRISAMTCSCFCCENCKHQAAAILQLQKALKLIEEEFPAAPYFAMIPQSVFEKYILDQMGEGSVIL